MIGTRSKKLFAAACLSAGVAFAHNAMAQEAPAPSAPATEAPAPDMQAPPVTDEKLQSFAVAFVEIEKIKQDYAQRLQKAESETDQQEIQNEAGEKMLQAVEESGGISVNEYNQIIQSAQADPDLAKRLTDAIGQASSQ